MHTVTHSSRHEAVGLALCAAAAFLLCTASTAAAETVETSVATTMRKHPGESTRAVLKLRPGARLKVLKRKGRWLRVRVGKRVGWVTRTTVREAGAEDSGGANPTRWGKRRPQALRDGGEPPSSATYSSFGKPISVEVRVEDSPVLDLPGEGGRELRRVEEGESILVIGEDARGDWLLISEEGGRVGWVAATTVSQNWHSRRESLALTRGGAAVRRKAPAEPPAEPLGPTQIGVRVGMQSLAMTFESDGAAGYGNYRISARAMTASVGARLAVGGEDTPWCGGIDGSARTGYSSPGIRYASSTGEVGDIPFSTYEASAGMLAGLRISSRFGGTELLGRVGYHYGVFSPHDIYNHGKLPREFLRGATAGLRLHLPALHDGLSLAIEADVLLAGQRAQTIGLEDGTVNEVSAAWGGAHFSYPVTGDIGLHAGYRFGRATTSWEGTSARQPDATEARREDREHLVLVGLAYGR